MKTKNSSNNLLASSVTTESKYYRNAVASLKVSNVSKQVKNTSKILEKNKIASF